MKSSRQRFLMTFLAVALALAFLSVLRVHYRNERAWLAHTDQLLRDKVVILAQSLDPADPSAPIENEQQIQAEIHELFWQIFDKDGRPLTQQKSGQGSIFLPDNIRTNLSTLGSPRLFTQQHSTLGRLRSAIYPVTGRPSEAKPPTAYAMVALSLEKHAKGSFLRFANVALGATIYCLLLVGAAAWLSSRWLTSLGMIAESARQLSQQELPRQRLPVPEKEPELAEFARVCNQMFDRVETAYATRQQFIADASHELRTPLTILRGEIDVALRRDRDPERYRQVLNSNREEIERLCRLLDCLLLLARADAGRSMALSERVQLTKLCREVVDKMAPMARQRYVKLETDGDAPVFAQGDRASLENMITNLVDNAIHHTPAGENIVVRVMEDKDGASIQVADTGRGIPAEALPHIFKRFYRVEGANTTRRNGAGLGLAIVQALAEAHGGRVTVESKLGQGSVFNIWLPKPSDPPSADPEIKSRSMP